jgi:hypothetical protein
MYKFNIDRAKAVHGDTYDYSLVEYVNSKTKVKIICKIHGIFEQTLDGHSVGKGCNECGKLKRAVSRTLDKDKAVDEMRSKHNSFYDYSKFNYVKSSDKSIIICPLHGEFLQSHNIHRKGVGCPHCGNEVVKNKMTKTTEELINKSNELFNSKFNFSNSVYECRFCNITITCPTHGDFLTTPANHLTSKYGCEKCANAYMGENAPGWSHSKWNESAKVSENFDSFKVYILRCWNEEEEFYKIGKTFTKIKLRYGRKKEMPYNFEVCKIIISKDFKFICELENRLKRESKDNKYLPSIYFGGRNECYSKII